MTNVSIPWNKIFVLGVLVSIAASIQSTGLVSLGGIKINLILSFLIVLSFFVRRMTQFVCLLIVAVVMLEFRPTLEFSMMILAIVVAAIFFAKEWLPGKQLINCLLFVAVGTILFYGLIDFTFLTNNITGVLIEMIYNALVSAIIFILCEYYIPYAEETRITS